jgi:urease accessory protein
MLRFTTRLSGLAFMLSCLATGAQAHHAMDGETPSNFAQGFISGLAHPVIGLDHLAFIVAAGTIAGAAGLGLAVPVAFVVASILGVAIHLQEFNLPGVELVIAASVATVGLALASGRIRLGSGGWAALFALAGLFHGYAYGESIVGAESTPLWAYLAGLAIVQSVIAVGVAYLASGRAWTATALMPRLVGAAVFGIGLTALAGQVIPA